MPFILLLIVVFSVSRFVDCSSLALTCDSAWWQYVTFNLLHASLFHLIINSIAILIYWRILKNVVNRYFFIIILAISVFISAFLGCCKIPTVGASAIGYAMIGIYTVSLYSGLLNIKRSTRIEFLVAIGLSFVSTWLFAPSINTPIHVYAFSVATILSFICRKYMYELQKK